MLSWALCYPFLPLMIIQITRVDSRCECSNRQIVLTNEEDFQLISSPNYPRPYCSSLDCEWKIASAGDGSKIYFDTENMDIRENIDFIEFYEDDMLRDPEDLATQVHRCTGKNDCNYASDGPVLTIKFRTGVHGTTDNQGFHGIVSGHNRRLRVILANVARFAIPLSIIFVLVSVMSVSCILCKNKMRETERLRVAEERLVEDQKNGLLQ